MVDVLGFTYPEAIRRMRLVFSQCRRIGSAKSPSSKLHADDKAALGKQHAHSIGEPLAKAQKELQQRRGQYKRAQTFS